MELQRNPLHVLLARDRRELWEVDAMPCSLLGDASSGITGLPLENFVTPPAGTAPAGTVHLSNKMPHSVGQPITVVCKASHRWEGFFYVIVKR